MKKMPRPLKVAFLCQHGGLSTLVARYANKIKTPGVQIENRGFGITFLEDLTQLKNYDLILSLHDTTDAQELFNTHLNGVKVISPEVWAAHTPPRRNILQWVKKLQTKHEPHLEIPIELALRAKNWLKKEKQKT